MQTLPHKVREPRLTKTIRVSKDPELLGEGCHRGPSSSMHLAFNTASVVHAPAFSRAISNLRTASPLEIQLARTVSSPSGGED
jgi:hypothetical protein